MNTSFQELLELYFWSMDLKSFRLIIDKAVLVLFFICLYHSFIFKKSNFCNVLKIDSLDYLKGFEHGFFRGCCSFLIMLTAHGIFKKQFSFFEFIYQWGQPLYKMSFHIQVLYLILHALYTSMIEYMGIFKFSFQKKNCSGKMCLSIALSSWIAGRSFFIFPDKTIISPILFCICLGLIFRKFIQIFENEEKREINFNLIKSKNIELK